MRALWGVISRDPEQVERRALLGIGEQVLGSISYTDTPHLRAARHPVFNLFSIDTKKCRKSVDRHSQCCLVGWTPVTNSTHSSACLPASTPPHSETVLVIEARPFIFDANISFFLFSNTMPTPFLRGRFFNLLFINYPARSLTAKSN